MSEEGRGSRAREFAEARDASRWNLALYLTVHHDLVASWYFIGLSPGPATSRGPYFQSLLEDWGGVPLRGGLSQAGWIGSHGKGVGLMRGGGKRPRIDSSAYASGSAQSAN